MGDIVEFRFLKRSADAPVAAGGGKDAEILFFTGVRYERAAEPPALEGPPPEGQSGAPAHGGPARKRRRRA